MSPTFPLSSCSSPFEECELTLGEHALHSSEQCTDSAPDRPRQKSVSHSLLTPHAQPSLTPHPSPSRRQTAIPTPPPSPASHPSPSSPSSVPSFDLRDVDHPELVSGFLHSFDLLAFALSPFSPVSAPDSNPGRTRSFPYGFKVTLFHPPPRSTETHREPNTIRDSLHHPARKRPQRTLPRHSLDDSLSLGDGYHVRFLRAFVEGSGGGVGCQWRGRWVGEDGEDVRRWGC